MKLIKVPGLNNLGKNGGCRNSCNAVVDELKRLRDVSVLDFEEIKLDNSDVSEQEKTIYKNCKRILSDKNKVIFVGGDHSISYSIGKAFLEVYGNESYLIIFDAHADCMPPMSEPTHEEWLRALVERGFNPNCIILVGLRRIELEERQFLDLNKIRYYEIAKIEDFEILCDGIMEFVNNGNVYVSLDIDAVDPAFAPSTGYLEPGGFSSREILYFARRLSKLKNLKVIDLVEINSEKDAEKDNVTVKLGAKIIDEFLK